MRFLTIFLFVFRFSILSAVEFQFSEVKTCQLPIPKPSVAATSREVLGARADMVLQNGDVGLTREQLITAFQFIETRTRKNFEIYAASKTKLPCQIEHSKALHGYVIRKIRSKAALIGHGCHKTVKKAILYGPRPVVLAECISDPSAEREIFALKKLRGAPGIVPYFGSVKRWKKYSIFLKYYSQGSLLHRLHNGEAFTESQILSIALDAAKGLQSIHKKRLVHRDLHAGNVLLNISTEGCHAVLVDFGKTLRIDQTKDSTPQAARLKNPPEVLTGSWTKLDRYKVDVYALGCLFYQMVWTQNVPWADLYNVYSIRSYGASQRKWMYGKSVYRYKTCFSHKVGELIRKKKKGLRLTKYERFKILIFEMIHFKPKDRPAISRVVSLLKDIQ